MEPSFIKDWDRYFDTVARVNPVKLKESAFPLTLDEMQDMFKSVAMGVEVEEAKLQPTMMAFLKDLEHMFQALPVKAFHPQALKKELESAVDSPDLNKTLRTEEHQTRHRLLCCSHIWYCFLSKAFQWLRTTISYGIGSGIPIRKSVSIHRISD